jgi:non-canonical purine NTP pyrophosphatase (RdgB/HAM1 family)
MDVPFVTSNAAKFSAMQMHAAAYGVTVIQHSLPLIEPQSDRVAAVAQSKAAQAYAQLGRACIVEDTGFAIDALDGFPGPYVRYVIATIGAVGLLRLASTLTERTCRFITVLVYVSASGEQEMFTSNNVGTLADQAGAGTTGLEWSELVQVFIPEGHAVPLSERPLDEFQALLRGWAASSVYAQCARWLAENGGDA